MILQSLNSLYERLADDPDSGIAPLGYSPQKIVLEVLIDHEGKLVKFNSITRKEGKKELPQILQVFGGAKPSGSGLNPCFLWDNTAYLLGYKPEDSKPARTQEAFEESCKFHLGFEQEINHPAYSAVCRFLQSWQPASASEHEELVQSGGGFLVFRISGEQRFVHQIPEIKDWWNQRLSQSTDTPAGQQMLCLVTGKTGPVALTHDPKIKGVRDAQSSGAALVSFNADSYESLGKKQSLNAPVSVQATFQYCTALNYLLSRENKRSFLIGDATVVYWTEKATVMENVFSAMLDPVGGAEDESTRESLGKMLHQIARGQYPGLEEKDLQTSFYVLGLSPNAARLSVRFWYVCTVKEMVDHLRQHMQDLEVCGRSEKDLEMPAIWQWLSETVRESKDLPPLLAGAVMKSILTGQRYPDLLMSAVLRRIRVDGTVNYRRASIVKAWLKRKYRFDYPSQEKEITVSLNADHPESVYHLGRLFAELEKAQEDALPGINATIKDRFFGAASATPAAVFPRLIRLNQHHLGKLEAKAKTYREKRIQEICQRIDDFPGHLTLKNQGLFALGYYHQRADIFKKKSTAAPEEEQSVAVAVNES